MMGRWGVAALVLLAGAPALAQRSAKVACKVDVNASWFVKQRAWLDDSKTTWSNDTLRGTLLRAAGLEPTSQLALQYGFEVDDSVAATTPADTAMIAQLRALAAARGSVWPTKSVVGAGGVRAVWLLAHRDTALARATLKRMMEAGPEESHAADVAMLEDRLRLLWGRKQLYGTQFRPGAGEDLVLAPTEDSAHVDLRREAAGLPPFRTSACLARARAER
jgi:hypothetical protein